MNKLFPIVLVFFYFIFSQLNLPISKDIYSHQGQSNLPISKNVLDSIAKLQNSPDYDSKKSVARFFTGAVVTETMRENAEKARKEMIYQGIWISVSLCVILFIVTRIIIYLKRKRKQKLNKEIKKNIRIRRLEKRINKLEDN